MQLSNLSTANGGKRPRMSKDQALEQLASWKKYHAVNQPDTDPSFLLNDEGLPSEVLKVFKRTMTSHYEPAAGAPPPVVATNDRITMMLLHRGKQLRCGHHKQRYWAISAEVNFTAYDPSAVENILNSHPNPDQEFALEQYLKYQSSAVPGGTLLTDQEMALRTMRELGKISYKSNKKLDNIFEDSRVNVGGQLRNMVKGSIENMMILSVRVYTYGPIDIPERMKLSLQDLVGEDNELEYAHVRPLLKFGYKHFNNPGYDYPLGSNLDLEIAVAALYKRKLKTTLGTYCARMENSIWSEDGLEPMLKVNGAAGTVVFDHVEHSTITSNGIYYPFARLLAKIYKPAKESLKKNLKNNNGLFISAEEKACLLDPNDKLDDYLGEGAVLGDLLEEETVNGRNADGTPISSGTSEEEH